MNQNQIKSNLLWHKVINATSGALKIGALHPIATQCELIPQDEVQFILRILENLQRKDNTKKEQKKKQKESDGNFNPFLPYDKDLFVTDLSDTHVCILNKFNVVDHHLLLITREFEEQENSLNLADFTAIWQVLQEIDGLGFYNSGKLAGASQPHKHLQLVPFPLLPTLKTIPLEQRIISAEFKNNIGVSSSLPFVHGIALLKDLDLKTPLESAKITLDYYHQLLDKLGLEINGDKPSGAYNLLITRNWLFIVPRAAEKFQSISINSLGFAGALLVKNEEQRQLILDTKPLNVLKQVAVEK
jgi:ATP adenylyltransferase